MKNLIKKYDYLCLCDNIQVSSNLNSMNLTYDIVYWKLDFGSFLKKFFSNSLKALHNNNHEQSWINKLHLILYYACLQAMNTNTSR